MQFAEQRKTVDRSADLDLAAYAAAAERLTKSVREGAVREAARAASAGARGLTA